jgi:Holliday junction resolvase RusA-like endonuclease
MIALANNIRRYRPVVPWAGPVLLEVTFTLRPTPDNPWRIPPLFPSRRPDLDNLCKLVFDALNHAGFYDDDAQIVRLVAAKVHGAVESTAVVISRP